MIGTAGALSVPGLVEDLHTTCFFDQFKCPSVVVIGVVNRGKSTLVNELIGESIAPQAFTPETATLLGITNDPGNRPSGFTKSGSLKILPSNPKRFSKWLRRGSKIQMASAIFPLAAQLPGVRRAVFNLVDEPADGDPDGVSELWFDSLDDFTAAYATEIGQAVVADTLAHVASRQRLFVTEHPLTP